MTKTNTINGFLLVVLMVAIGVLILPAVSTAQATNGKQTGCKAKVESENDADDADKKANESKYAKEAKITMAEAKAIALKKVPGTILEEDLEKEDGRLQYAFDICSENNQIFDVEVDAKTGEALKAELDHEKDNDDGNQQNGTTRKQNIFVKTAGSVKRKVGKMF